MTTTGTGPSIRVPLSRSQRNIYNGVVQDGDPALYLIGRRYRFQPLRLPELLSALDATIRANPVHLCVLEPGGEDGYRNAGWTFKSVPFDAAASARSNAKRSWDFNSGECSACWTT